jgi:integrase
VNLVHVPSTATSLHVGLVDDMKRAAEHATHARAPRTRREYARAWSSWTSYALDHGASALPASPLVVAAYLAHLDAEGLGPSSIDVALAAIAEQHRAKGYPLPSNDGVVRDVRAGLRARRGTCPKSKAALGPFELEEICSALPPDIGGTRDRALFLVGFGAALRRSELVALRVQDVAWHARGIVVHVARSKTDQHGAGYAVPIHAAPGPLCPVAALRAWLEAACIETGPIFRSVSKWGRVGSEAMRAAYVAVRLKRAALRVGLDTREIAGHSLRSGFATTAANVGANLPEIGRITRHASEGQLRKYIRAGTMFERDPLRGILCR